MRIGYFSRGGVCYALAQWSTQTLLSCGLFARNIEKSSTMHCVRGALRVTDVPYIHIHHVLYKHHSCTVLPFMWGSLRLAPMIADDSYRAF